MKVLLAEDDAAIAEGLVYAMHQEGYDVIWVTGVEDALHRLDAEPVDLALLDLALPDGSGYEICRRIRDGRNNMPVIFLTACDDEVNVVMGLDMGADDYITKPFRIRELMSRIKSVTRRCLKCLDDIPDTELRVCADEARVYKQNREIVLTALEYRLLLIFSNNRGRILTRTQLLQNIWDVSGDFVNDNTLTVYIKRLRDKLEDDPQNPSIIQTVRGLGYRMGEKSGV